jgi:hypothetical protein
MVSKPNQPCQRAVNVSAKHPDTLDVEAQPDTSERPHGVVGKSILGDTQNDQQQPACFMERAMFHTAG